MDRPVRQRDQSAPANQMVAVGIIALDRSNQNLHWSTDRQKSYLINFCVHSSCLIFSLLHQPICSGFGGFFVLFLNCNNGAR